MGLTGVMMTMLAMTMVVLYAKQIQPGLYNCPDVSKSSHNYLDGNQEFCDNIEQVPLHMVPYVGSDYHKASSLQVFSTD